ncbi:MAG: serine hydrolase [Planctomycetota bacterium]
MSSALLLGWLSVFGGIDRPAGLPDHPKSAGAVQAARIEAVVRAWHEAGKFNGTVLVADAGEIVWQGGFGPAVREWDRPNGPDVRYPICSLTKQFTAHLVMQAVERGDLALDGVITDYLPDYRSETGRKVTIRHLLSHASGLPEVETELFFDPRPEAEDVAKVVTKFGSGDLTFEPGSASQYGNTDYFVLQAILERVSGSSFETLLEEKIVKPLGLRATGIARRDAIIPKRANDYTRSGDGWTRTAPYQWENWGGAGGLYSTVGDLHLWNRALVGHTLVSESTTRTMWTPVEKLGYVGLGSWVYTRGLPGVEARPKIVERRGAIGGFAILNVIVPETQRWMVILSNHYNEDIHTLPYADCLPLDLLLVLYGGEPKGPPATAK